MPTSSPLSMSTSPSTESVHVPTETSSGELNNNVYATLNDSNSSSSTATSPITVTAQQSSTSFSMVPDL